MRMNSHPTTIRSSISCANKLSNVIVLVLFQLVRISAKIYEIPCGGGADDFKAMLALVKPGDVIQLAAPCTYDLSYENYYGKQVYNLADEIPDANFRDENTGFMIRGGTTDPSDTIVKARLHYTDASIVFENLSLSPHSGRPVELDDDKALLFRNCVIEMNGGDEKEAIFQMSHVTSVIDSEIMNNDPSIVDSVGVATENHFTLLRSTIGGFDTGLLWDLGADPTRQDEDIIFGNDLTDNTNGKESKEFRFSCKTSLHMMMISQLFFSCVTITKVAVLMGTMGVLILVLLALNWR